MQQLVEKRQELTKQGQVKPLIVVDGTSKDDFPLLPSQSSCSKTPPPTPVWVNGRAPKRVPENLTIYHSVDNKAGGLMRTVITILELTQERYPHAENEINALVDKLGIMQTYKNVVVAGNAKQQTKAGPK